MGGGVKYFSSKREVVADGKVNSELLSSVVNAIPVEETPSPITMNLARATFDMGGAVAASVSTKKRLEEDDVSMVELVVKTNREKSVIQAILSFLPQNKVVQVTLSSNAKGTTTTTE